MNYYHQACLYSVQRDTRTGLHWLERAFAKGFRDWEHLGNDADLRTLRKTAEGRRLLERYREKR
jgi:hypothetical protein